MLPKGERDAKLDELEKQTAAYVKRQRELLNTERDFLQGVLDRTVNNTTAPYDKLVLQLGLTSAKDLVGLDE